MTDQGAIEHRFHRAMVEIYQRANPDADQRWCHSAVQDVVTRRPADPAVKELVRILPTEPQIATVDR
ncbi:MAG: hypothetical protein WD532_11175 [Acidimicrobiia bacterium]